ncbi:NAD-binding protein [Kribbella deserti]|uniref:NAD-binding protein n=1 Tax=Kribbella deserti TaxID=1926257 RepID=A0ABV6QK33_9ACTN
MRPVPAGRQPSSDGRSVVVCGSDRTTLRVVSELVDSGERVTAIVNPDSRHFERIGELADQEIGVRVLSENVLVRAGIGATDGGRSAARALVLLDTNDVRNVHAALTARDLDPKLRIIVQMVNPRIGEQLHALLGDCVVISGPSLAAPAFVADALEEDELIWTDLGGRRLVAGPAERIKAPHLTVLADTTSSARPDLLPDSSDDPTADVVLGTSTRRQSITKDVRRAGLMIAIRDDVFDRRVRWIMAVMAAVALGGTMAIAMNTGPDVTWLHALYLALGAVTSAGIEDDLFVHADPWVKVVAVGVQLIGIVLVALLTAVVVDSLIGARLSRVIGGVRGKPRNHVVVSGLGTVGARVLELLTERGVAVVGIEKDENAPGVQTAHRLRIPVIIGDGSTEETLRSAGASRCMALLAITDGDITNLETAMVVRGLNPDAKITMRMFDHDLAQRVERRLNIGTSRSVSMLVAPAVAAAVSNRLAQATVPAGRRVLLLTEVVVEPNSVAVGRRLGELQERGQSRIMAIRKPPVGRREADWDWEPRSYAPVEPGLRIAVAATRSGLARLLLATRAPRGGTQSERMEP